ncbi:hypothetical protein [Streptomyces sp. HUAS TT20]|uniref:hypothetical protein n=1 Tax=Streptomyces sp. HUAS TT20 TaxID=3447509 RepID=UPI0021D93514|nr:hypothetical protein [Streptomyces sp. HUAS 15-9]UXY28570.1 hypothetical protein N8I87_19730 [Streptomyces sp. HUAS 15-9]
MTPSDKPRTGTGQARNEQASLAAGRAAGYCWERNPDGPGRCTRAPHADGEHVDYYNGRQQITDVHGYTWS